MHEAIGAVESYSPAEEQFNRRRRTWGLFLAPALFLLVLVLPLGVDPPAHRLAAVLALVVVLWVSEALPMAATALLGPTLAVMLQVAPVRAAFAPFADPIIFVFIGSFILAEAMFVHGLDRRVAFTALASRWVGKSGVRLLVAYGAVATVLSMWISNTATTAMMFPIGVSMLAQLRSGIATSEAGYRRFAVALMLMTSFGASVGGLATPVGTPPNLIGIGLIERIQNVHIGFFQWMAIGLPIVVVLFAFLAALFAWVGARGVRMGDESLIVIQRALAELGPMTRGQRNVLLAFGCTVCLWVAPGLLAIIGLGDAPLAAQFRTSMPEGVAALLGATLLFVLPISWPRRQFTLRWEEAVRIDWGIILLYGGGLALGDLAFSTGLATALGNAVAASLPSTGPLALTMAFTGAAILLSEATSNTASANMVVPIALAVSVAAGVDPLVPAIGATLGASMGFMMPISTAPNAIVYSSGHVPITAMMRYGVALDIAGFVVIVTALSFLL